MFSHDEGVQQEPSQTKVIPRTLAGFKSVIPTPMYPDTGMCLRIALRGTEYHVMLMHVAALSRFVT